MTDDVNEDGELDFLMRVGAAALKDDNQSRETLRAERTVDEVVDEEDMCEKNARFSDSGNNSSGSHTSIAVKVVRG